MERTHASEVIDLDEVDALVASGHLVQTHHATLPYRILNYTVRTVIDRRWSDTTERCRGLVIDDDNFIVARPIRKFHNYTSVRPPGYVLTRKPLLYHKVDGSLGIVVPTLEGSHIVSTRGSFVSDQAIHATDLWARRYRSVTPPPGVTLLVEIVYPANRIVVDNGGLDDLVLLAAIRHDTGADIPLWEIEWPGPVATLHPQLSLDDAYNFTTGDAMSLAEGTVLLWTHPDQESYRLKIKHPDYVRRHAAIFRLSTVSVWRFLSAGHSLEALLDELPDEVHGWARTAGLRLLDQHRSVVARFETEAAGVPRNLPRAEQALLVKRMEHPGPVFRLLDGSTIDEYVWKLIRPEFEPFRLEPPSDI
jgi:RNA ligase